MRAAAQHTHTPHPSHMRSTACRLAGLARRAAAGVECRNRPGRAQPTGPTSAAACWALLRPASSAAADAPSPPPSIAPSHIRNFAIIAHVDHGKSTLADRLLSLTNTVPPGQMRAQFLDGMDLERERGITIKLAQARMRYTSPLTGETYALNLIDTPGHVDFSYEVSRSLAACEGALLVVDAAQGVQAQTLANVHLALEAGLEIIPVLNKVDLPGADAARVAAEVEEVVGLPAASALLASAKTGLGVPAVLEAIVHRIPPPQDTRDKPLRALVFDSRYDPYRGVIVSVRVVDGRLRPGDGIRLVRSGKAFTVEEVGVLSPHRTPVKDLGAGEVGYVSAGIKAVTDARVGDTVAHAPGGGGGGGGGGPSSPAAAASPLPAVVVAPLPGYAEPRPMVFAGLFPTEADRFPDVREALGRLRLNDAALSFEPETSPAMGTGFRCGFLGLLHMEVVQERLEREYGLDLIITAPTVVYRVVTQNAKKKEHDAHDALSSPPSIFVSNPADVPEGKGISLEEPFVRVDMLTPARFVGALMALATSRRGEQVELRYLSGGASAALSFDMPLAEVVTDLHAAVKARSQGFASLDYSSGGVALSYRPSDLVRLDVKVNGEPAPPLSCIVHRSSSYRTGRALVSRLAALIPRHQFRVALQAAIGGRVIASEAIPALRKDVLAKCYGGDVSRKKKLLAKQAKGKKRMKAIGRVEVPQAAFFAVLGVGGGSGGSGGGEAG